MATFKVKVPVEKLSNLMKVLAGSENPFKITRRWTTTVDEIPGYIEKREESFVTLLPGDRKFDGQYIEIVMELLVQYSDIENGADLTRKVGRDMLGKLCDVLDIFPRYLVPLNLAEIKERVDEIRNIASAYRVKKDSRGQTSDDLLDAVGVIAIRFRGPSRAPCRNP
ncbi:hypothetical protein KW784_01575 [Candidatus Parcubacteria bacterium]|nr:hypothetical protein [Candidatus Parcubacteria bacterium]